MKIGDEVYIHGYIDEIRKDTVIIRNNGGYFGTVPSEVITGELPSAQPFHNITMNDVLKYIDGMPEDVWQEFTACLECRGWELQRRTAKWCGSEFA